MGLGDNLMGTGLARGAAARGKRVAFGDHGKIRWDQHSAEIFRGNPNVAPPGSEGAKDLEWVAFYKGHRVYNSIDPGRKRWRWNHDFRAVPGEMFFSDAELVAGSRYGTGFVLVEPNVPVKSAAPNKDWGFARFQQLVDYLRHRPGIRLMQFATGRLLDGVAAVATTGFRDALAILKNARLYIGPEGGLHHGAAALGVPAVVIFGGFIPPAITGYATHSNLTGSKEFCGALTPCAHCRQAMENITVDQVYEEARKRFA